MVKIKQKKQLNLPQLIEWLLESGKSKCIVISNMNNIVRLEPYGVIRFSQENFYPEDTFTVEEEVEITEDTVLPILIERRDFGNELTYSRYEYVRIKDIKEESSTLFYIENDDSTMTLIWRDGRLIE
ncbi:hypothetical protein AB6G74_09535 [Staphylococcus ureilyticus]|uniref:hypothetical protein n=1 Tax=Staphylococcus ureilyticus TaxID=94138 RepID=UPI0034DD7D2F